MSTPIPMPRPLTLRDSLLVSRARLGAALDFVEDWEQSSARIDVELQADTVADSIRILLGLMIDDTV